ncbi:cytochrome bc complex cytochrome b subunit [Streptomyces sp. NPDC086077]|uniref:cytochrome bc1 complex cytochrome b subunit n=1 Tax=Streptomyces sp. NPDC086077 TaxID=3154862 RepID=UPI003428D404
MENESTSTRARLGGAGMGEKVAQWVDRRLGTRHLKGTVMSRVFPDHWSFLLAQICLYSFLVLLVTGIYLSFYFHPSSAPMVYQGSYAPLRGQLVSEAFNSTMHISFDVRGGLLIRQAHHWAALIFVAAMLTHVMRVFFTGAYRMPREISWVIGLLLLVLGMFGGLTGYDLPDDLLSGTGLAVVNGTLLSIPVVGTYLSMFLFGGSFPGDDVIGRFNTIHVVLIPAVMVTLIVVQIVLFRRQGNAQFPGPGRTNRNVVGLPFRVYAAKSGGYFFLVTGMIFTIASIAQINPIWRYGPYRADQVSAGSQPDWYMGVADGLLRVMPGWEINAWGHTLALDNLIPLMASAGLFLALGVYPFIESWATGDDREHHLLDRPRNRPVRTGFGAAWLTAYGVALIGAANDLIATQLHVSVNAVTWAVRVGLVAAPPIAYVVAKRWALGLQRRDRDMVLHGRETGVIRRLPHGEFVEVHQPLARADLYTLTAHQQYAPLTAAPVAAGHGADPRPTASARLRAGLSRVLYGPGTQIPKPTADEDRQITGPHRP